MDNTLWFMLGVSISFNFFLWWRNDDLNSALEAQINEALEQEIKAESKDEE